MSTIRLKKRIDSETLHLPELRHLIGKTVDIIVQDESEPATNADEFWNPPTLDELAKRQGVRPVTFNDLLGSFTDEDFEGFEEHVAEMRKRWRKSDGRGKQ